MIVQFFLFPILFLLLYSVSVRLTETIYGLTFLVTGSSKLALGILTLILMPGTIVHEMSHFLAATLLRVSTGRMTVFPESLEKGRIRAGKLEVGDCDPFRKTIIGIAPMIFGLIIIYLIGHFFIPSISLTTNNLQLTTFIGVYLLLTVSATMFSSPKDLESLLIVIPIMTVLFLVFYFLGLRISLTGNLLKGTENLVSKLNYALIVTVAADLIIVLLNRLGIAFFEKVLGRKLVRR